MNNKQQVYATEAWKYRSLIPEPATLRKHGFTMFMPTGQRYDTQQMGGGELMVNMIHPSASNMTSVWTQPFETQKFQENVFVDFSTINSAITSKLRSVNYS